MRSNSNAALVFILISVLLDTTGFGLIFPVLPELIKQLIHGDLSLAATYGGWLAFAFAVMQFFFAPILGNLSDRFGRRPVLLATLVAFGVNYALMAFSQSIFWLFVGRMVAGITGASYSVANAYIADISTPEKKAQNFGLIGAMFSVGFIIGPVLGGLLGQYGVKAPFFAAAGLSLVNTLYGYFVLPESLSEDKRRPFSWRRANPIGSLAQLKRFPSVIALLIALMLLYFAGHSMETLWAFYGMEKFRWDEKTVGFSLGMSGVLGAIVQGALIRLIIPKLGEKRTVVIGLTVWGVCFILFALATQSWMMFVILVPESIAGVGMAALQGLISNTIPENEQGELQGGQASLIAVTTILSPPVMTGLFAFFSKDSAPVYFPGAPFVLAGLLVMVAMAIAIRSFRRIPSPQHQTESIPA